MSTYHIQYKNQALKVEVDVSPAEPDIGICGNGEVAVAVEDVLDEDGNSLMDTYSAIDVDDIAHEVYKTLGVPE